MTTLLQRIRTGSRAISTLEDYSQALSMYNPYGADLYLGAPGSGMSQTLMGDAAEEIRRSFTEYTRKAYQENGIVFACMLARMSVFSAARFQWQRLRDGSPSDTFGSRDLSLLERPWAGGTTQDLLSRMIQDADLAGNAFVVRVGTELVRLRPDWVDIVVANRLHRWGIRSGDGREGILGKKRVGYIYYEGGKQQCDPEDIVPLLPDEVCHWMPTPDPEASFRGMSWLTPVVREVQGDQLMNRHKAKFFENGATPNMVIKHIQGADPVKVKRFNEMLQEEFGGIENAYKTLNLYPGADVTVVGKDFKQIDLRGVQGAGETRIAAAAGVPPIIAGFSEGLAAATYSNYGQARRRFADGTVHPLWQNVAGSMEVIVPRPAQREGSLDFRLWYDVRDVPFLREDAVEAASIEQTKATTVKTYVDAGFTPESAVAAVDAQDVRLLVHTGLVSVQLLPADGSQPGAADAPADGADAEPQIPEDERRARAVAELMPRVSTGVDKVVDAQEARAILNWAGAGLTGEFTPPEPPPAPAPPAAAPDGGDTGTNSAVPAGQQRSEPMVVVPPPNVTVHVGDGERANPYKDKKGKFTYKPIPDMPAPGTGGSGGLITTGARGANLSPKGKAAVDGAMKKHGLTRDGIRNEIRGRIKGPALTQGRGWYKDARTFHEGLAKQHGIDIERITAATAAISPRCQWPENRRLTARLLELHADPANASLSDVDLARVLGGQALPVNKEMAVRLLRGTVDVETGLTGQKRRSFYNNMLQPGETDDVTVDVWASLAAVNSSTTGMTAKDAESFLGLSKVSTDGGAGYTILADAYRDVAAELDMSPDEVQAVYWTSVTGSVDGKFGDKG